MTGRAGELAGHLWSTRAELEEAALRAYVQTGELARAGTGITYAMVPDEARLMIDSALQRKPPAEQARLEIPFSDRCLVPWTDNALEVRFVCLLPAGHDLPAGELNPTGVGANYVPEHGWYRFLDAAERGEELGLEAVARLEHRLEEARRRLR